MNNAISFKCPECGKNMNVDAIWTNKEYEFFLQAYCLACSKEFNYSVSALMAAILEEMTKNYVQGPSTKQ